MIVNVQAVVPQEAKPGEPPPIPQADPTKPIVSVVLIRDQGNVRAKPAAFFFISAALFAFFTLLLHFRDKTVMANRALEPDSPAVLAEQAHAAELGGNGHGSALDRAPPDDGGG